MKALMTQLLFEEVKCQWSMSRPLLGLIIANPEHFTEWKAGFIQRQSPDLHLGLEEVKKKII